MKKLLFLLLSSVSCFGATTFLDGLRISSLTNYAPKVMSIPSGGQAIPDMQAATSDYVGEFGLSFPGNKEMAVWMAANVGTGSNAWDYGAVDFFQGLHYIGHPFLMPSIVPPGIHIYQNGNAIDQSKAQSTNNNGSCIFIHNLNPRSDFNGICIPMATTNTAGLLVSTNADGEKIYEWDAFGMCIGSISEMQNQGETNQCGSQIILSERNFPTLFSLNFVGVAGEGAGYNQHSYMAIDPATATFSTKFPLYIPNVWNPVTNLNNIDVLRISQSPTAADRGSITLYSNLYLGGAIMATQQTGMKASTFGPNWPDSGNGLAFLVTTNAHFGGNNDIAVTFDFQNFHRLGIQKISTAFPKHTHSSTAPWTVARSSSSDLQTLPLSGQTLTDEFQIDTAGNVSVTNGSSLNEGRANGEYMSQGTATELLTLSTGGTTTDTAANLLPANSIIDAVVTRVTTTITTATAFSIGDGTTATRFSASAAGLASGSTRVGLDHMSGAVTTLAAGPTQAAAAKVRITTTGTPGAGVIRITVFYRTFNPPTQ